MKTGVLGFPRIGRKRELKRAVERYWKGDATAAELHKAAASIRSYGWMVQKDANVDFIPSNDFSFYDQMLDTTAMLGAVPPRFQWSDDKIDLEVYFAMARGRAGVPAMEMTKWFDTNYHYIVPELAPDQKFRLASTKPIDEYLEAKQQGVATRPVLIGPVTYLLLSKMTNGSSDQLIMLEAILPIYCEVIRQLAAAGAEWIQLDEPILATDLPMGGNVAFRKCYEQLTLAAGAAKIQIATYFGTLEENWPLVGQLPVAGLHIDLVRGAEQLGEALRHWPKDRWLSLGLVDGRNIWRCNLDAAGELLKQAIDARGSEQLIVSPSCSLLHVPYDLTLERNLDEELKGWLAFAVQKLDELRLLASTSKGASSEITSQLDAARRLLAGRKISPRVRRSDVQERCSKVDPSQSQRPSPFATRIELQSRRFKLPAFPTTTIGSFPQTDDIRKARADYREASITDDEYEAFLRQEIKRVVEAQEKIGLDVLVHGEAERNDMVEYFGERLEGFALTEHGWVQSYGSRCVKPPIIYGDVYRLKPMTVRWSKYAKSLTAKPMKGMLTGPVTILQWSFVRDDQPRRDTCRQIAFALRDEVCDLEMAGLGMIQIDEPALREGLPLRRSEWRAYLDWACECFRIAASGVADDTQIHTHMCYAEFNDIMPAIAALDADVISIESSRSKMEVLEAFRVQGYPNHVGPGVYDIHSPRVPTAEEMAELLREATRVLSPQQIWVNPDCGLKTRKWPEAASSLEQMVAAARLLRSEMGLAER